MCHCPKMFTNKEHFLENMDNMMDELRMVPSASGVSQVMVPGEMEQKHHEYNLEKGISIVPTVYDYLATKKNSNIK